MVADVGQLLVTSVLALKESEVVASVSEPLAAAILLKLSK